MNKLRAFALGLMALPMMSFSWMSNFDKAKKMAVEQRKPILLKFSGSDWCVPCIRMEKEVFANEAFSEFSEKELVMVNADFPRLAKNKLSKDVAKQNDMLAEQYDKEGHFPYTVLLSPDGKVLKTWDGYNGKMKPEELIDQIRPYTTGRTAKL